MAATRKSSKPRPKDVAIDDLSPSAQVARQIVDAFVDLTPSVNRIMAAELSENQRLRAITAFQASLGSVGDPNRDPRYAVANCGPAD